MTVKIIKNHIKNGIKNCVKNQVGNRIKKHKRRKCMEASLTIEAAMSLTIFMFAVIILAMPMEMLDTQRRIQTILETTARDLSQYAYIRYKISQGEEIQDKTGITDRPEISGAITEGAVKVLLTAKIEEAAGKGKISNLDISGTTVSENGEQINLQAEYRLRLPFRVFALDSVPASSRSFKRGWIGSEGGRGLQGETGEGQPQIMVYVGKTRTRYHLTPNCHYISNDMSSLSWEQVGNQLSSSGTHYKPCSVCGKAAGKGSTVYIMPNGKYYHSKKDCSSIAYYVQKVPLSQVEYLGLCSYCGRGGG